MATQLENAKYAVDKASEKLRVCRSNVEHAKREADEAFQEWLEAERTYTALKLREELTR